MIVDGYCNIPFPRSLFGSLLSSRISNNGHPRFINMYILIYLFIVYLYRQFFQNGPGGVPLPGTPHFETAKVRRSVDAKAGTSFAKVGQRLVDTGVIVPMEI